MDFFFKQEKAKDGQSTEDGASAPVPSYVKHPLQNKWALWFFKNDKTKSWQDNLRLVTSFDTVSFAINLLTLFCCYDRYMIHYCMQQFVASSKAYSLGTQTKLKDSQWKY